METKRRVLVVEDEEELAKLVRLHLEDLGSSVTTAHDGHRALEILGEESFDLVVLDIGLPGPDGLEICRRLRSGPDHVPILMLTARSDEVDRVLGLEMGADDYLTKPFSIRELVARVKAIFRRMDAFASREGSSEKVLEMDGLRIEIERRRAVLHGESLELTPKEFDLLAHFARNPGRVYTRTELLDQVWGYTYAGYEHTVNSHINRLRGKLEKDPSAPRFIQTVWGVGYRFRDGEE